jgi:hypothetical protein
MDPYPLVVKGHGAQQTDGLMCFSNNTCFLNTRTLGIVPPRDIFQSVLDGRDTACQLFPVNLQEIYRSILCWELQTTSIC